MYELSLKENEIDFKSLEQKIYKLVCRQACNIMADILERLDKKLLEERDKKAYRCKGFKHTCLKTIMGTVEIDRRIYEHVNEEGKKQFIYLLDEYLNMETIGHMSPNIVEKIIENTTDKSFRKTAEKIEKSSNQNISHTAVWNIVQTLGEKIEEKEDREIILNENGKLKGEREVKVLFEEADGIWLSMQGKDKPKRGKSKKKELKLAVTYEGWKRRNGKSEAYLVENKIVCAGFTNSKRFKQLRDAKIAEVYNVDEIEVKIINGDGARWIKEGIDEEGVYFSLDNFGKWYNKLGFFWIKINISWMIF